MPNAANAYEPNTWLSYHVLRDFYIKQVPCVSFEKRRQQTLGNENIAGCTTVMNKVTCVTLSSNTLTAWIGTVIVPLCRIGELILQLDELRIGRALASSLDYDHYQMSDAEVMTTTIVAMLYFYGLHIHIMGTEQGETVEFFPETKHSVTPVHWACTTLIFLMAHLSQVTKLTTTSRLNM